MFLSGRNSNAKISLFVNQNFEANQTRKAWHTSIMFCFGSILNKVIIIINTYNACNSKEKKKKRHSRYKQWLLNIRPANGLFQNRKKKSSQPTLDVTKISVK